MLAPPGAVAQDTDSEAAPDLPFEKRIAARATTAMAVVVGLSLAVIPLAITPGLKDIFTLGKELAIRAEALIALMLLTIAIAFGGTARLRELFRERLVSAVVAGTLVWTVVTSLTSTNRMLSSGSVVTVAAAVLVFLLVWYAAPRCPVAVLYPLVAVSLVQTVLITLQTYRIWQPFQLEHGGVFLHTGTIGNPNVVGTYLAIVTVILAVAAVATKGWRRGLFTAGVAIALAGVAVSNTRTAILAVGLAAVLSLLRFSWKYAVIATIAGAAVFAIGIGVQFRPAVRIAETVGDVAQGQWNRAASDRIPAFLAAADMFRERPLVGFGPGTFVFHYLEYKTRVTERYPQALVAGTATHFGDVHNDHLQFLAEAGAPAYLLFVAAIVLLASGRAKPSDGDVRPRLASLLGFPLAAITVLVCLAQFPLQIGVTRHILVTMAALVTGWRRL